MADINWQAIQEDYENGTSLGQLSVLYGVPKSTIGDKSKAGRWTRTIGGRRTPPTPELAPPVETPPIEAVTLAKSALKNLSGHLEAGLTLKEHVMFSQSLTQYTKVIVASPATPDTQQNSMVVDHDLLSVMTMEEIDTMQRLLDQAKSRKLEQDGIAQLHRA